MKKILKKIRFIYSACAVYSLMIASSYAATEGAEANNPLCALIEQLHGVFVTLRVLAFVGAAFFIAQWAWGFISKGEVKMDDVTNKGTGLIVGFLLLFSIGIILGFVMGKNGICATTLKAW